MAVVKWGTACCGRVGTAEKQGTRCEGGRSHTGLKPEGAQGLGNPGSRVPCA